VAEVLHSDVTKASGDVQALAGGDLSLKGVTVIFGERSALKNVSMTVKHGTKTAIIGPTAAGKTQLLYLLTGLLAPTSGTVEYAGRNITEYDPVSLHQQIGFVFQDSIVFNLTLRENIAFSNTVDDADLAKAVATAELTDFIEALPQKLDTVVSERGTSLSGGQKQRIMLARALALNPSVLLLDDFTARVDTRTEKKILENVRKNYPGITLISVTQKVTTIEDYDQIVVLMEGDLLAAGTHEELMKTSHDYVLIHDSQRSTNAYEIRAE
jgi:ATP-binding cassette subfamily B protein